MGSASAHARAHAQKSEISSFAHDCRWQAPLTAAAHTFPSPRRSYFEDDDMIWRNFAAGLKVWAEPFVVVQHGRDEATGYQTGTALEDASGEFVAEVARSRNELYYTRKWGANATDSASIMRVQRSLARPQGCKGAASLAGRFCTRESEKGRPRGCKGGGGGRSACAGHVAQEARTADPAPSLTLHLPPPRAAQRSMAGGRSPSGASRRHTARACATAPRARSAASSFPRRSTEA